MAQTVKEIREKNLRLLIAESGSSQGAFANTIDTAAAYLSQIFSPTIKRSMGDQVARKIETKLNLPKGWMDSHHQSGEYKDYLKNPRQPQVLPPGFLKLALDNGKPHPDDVMLRFINPDQFNDQLHRPEIDEPLQQKLRFSKALLKKLGISESAALGLVVEGNSMAPVLPEGTLLVIDTENTDIKDGDMYALNHANQLRIKLIYHVPGGGLRLRSYNNAEWPDEYISLDEMHHITVLGRVFWWSVVR